jgi:hypothetical protein
MRDALTAALADVTKALAPTPPTTVRRYITTIEKVVHRDGAGRIARIEETVTRTPIPEATA